MDARRSDDFMATREDAASFPDFLDVSFTATEGDEITCLIARQLTVCEIGTTDDDRCVAIALGFGAGGLFTPMSAAIARNLAAALLSSANSIDGGRVIQ